MLDIQALRFRYPGATFTLDVPHMQLAAGERVAIVGPSGAGKTTLLNLIAGLIRPQQGQICVGTTQLDTLSARGLRQYRRDTLGFVFQDFRLIPYLSARDNILQGLRLAGRRQDASVTARMIALTQAAGVADKLGRRPDKLSQGEKQRVAICRALLTNPALILADEPTGNLDPNAKTSILQLLFDQAQVNKAAVLAVTHDHGLLDRFDRVLDFADFRLDTSEEPL